MRLCPGTHLKASAGQQGWARPALVPQSAADSLREPRHRARAQGSASVAEARPSKPWMTSAPSSTGETRWDEGKASAPTGRSQRGPGVVVNSHFDSGNVEVVSIQAGPGGGSELNLRIHEDPYCEEDKRNHFMWFFYRVTGVRGMPLSMRLTNAGQASYPFAWPGYQAVCSYNKTRWFRVPTEYDKEKGCLTITHTPEHDAAQYAYFAPYSFSRHQHFVADMQCHPSGLVRLEMLGETLDGHDLDMLVVGTPAPGKKKIWVVARQHPGETMAEFFVEGLLRRLLNPHDGAVRALLDQAVFYIVPCMNPDGAWRGHLRVNAAGANLNREWQSPTEERSPEVLYVLNRMHEVGVDFFADIHGDEALPYCFLSGNEGIPGWTARLRMLQETFAAGFEAASPDFQTQYGYGKGKPGKADMRIAAHAVGGAFDCLAFTLEMPFKDTANRPEPVQGWSPERCMSFGASMLVPLLQVLPSLR